MQTQSQTLEQQRPQIMPLKKVISKNCAPFINCISKINNTQISDANDIDVIIPMYNLIEYSNIYSKTSGRLCQYYRDVALDFINNIIEFLSDNNNDNNNNSILFKFNEKITGKTGNDGTKDVEIIVPSKYLNNLWRTLEMLLINGKINLQLKWSAKCYLAAGTVAGNVKLLKQLHSNFKRTVSLNKYQCEITNQAQNRYLDFLIDPSFQGVNSLFVLSFENENDQESYKRYYLPTVEIKDYNFMIEFF